MRYGSSHLKTALDDARAGVAVGKRIAIEDESQNGIVDRSLPYGQVWNWTANKYSDGRTGFTILKGGSWYTANDSPWYDDGGKQEACFAAKFLLFHAGLNRQATIWI